MKVFKMDKLEILEAEIKRKIIFIQNFLAKSRTTGNEVVETVPKYLNSISLLEKENATLKAEHERIEKEHNEDLKQVDELVTELSRLVEDDNA